MERIGHTVVVRVGEDGPVATFERLVQQLADRRRFARAGGADQLEVLGLVGRRHPDAGQRQDAGAMLFLDPLGVLARLAAVVDGGATLGVSLPWDAGR